jgi:hypothetical protein
MADGVCETIFQPGQTYYSRYISQMTTQQQVACGVGDIGAIFYDDTKADNQSKLPIKHSVTELSDGGKITGFDIVYSISRDRLATHRISHLDDANSFDDTWPAGVGIGLGLLGLGVGYLIAKSVSVVRDDFRALNEAIEQAQAKDLEWQNIVTEVGENGYNPHVDIAPATQQ